MNLRYVLALSTLTLAPATALSQVGDLIETGQTCSYFGESLPAKVTSFSSDAEAEAVIKRIVDASGLVPNFEMRAAGVPNAAATIEGAKRLILYNQYFVRSLREGTGTPWAPASVMAHEVAHHFNGHTLEKSGSRPKIELEADYYSGFVLQRMGATMTEARAAMEKFGSPNGTATHPPKHDRLAAISSGWTKACEADPRCKSESIEIRQPDEESVVLPPCPVVKGRLDLDPTCSITREIVGAVRLCAIAVEGQIPRTVYLRVQGDSGQYPLNLTLKEGGSGVPLRIKGVEYTVSVSDTGPKAIVLTVARSGATCL